MWPWNKQGIASPNLNVTPNQQQYLSGTDWRSKMQPMSAQWGNTNQAPWEGYEDLIQNPEHMPNRLQNLERFQNNRFEGGDELVPGMNKKAIDFIDQPVNFMMRANHPTKFDPLVNAKNFAQNLPSNIKEGIGAIKKTGKKLMTPLMMFANSVNPLDPDSSNYNPRLKGQVEDLNKIGFLSGSSGKTGPYQITGGPLSGKHLVSAFGTNDYDEMLAKKFAWFQKRKDAKKSFSQKLWNEVIAEQDARATENTARDGDRANIEKIERYTGRPVSDYRMSRPASERQFTGHGKSGMGRSADRFAADGGRIGYQGGELVGQETDFIEGPQGGEEFQETVVEGQEQPSREQLEALAMEIFQLPLEELDEQQLLVVYQEAMQGQPMEEAVQEEDIQFAANGGLAGLL